MSITKPTPSRAGPNAVEVMYGSPVYSQVMQFLNKEARLLDHRELRAWSSMLATDLVYTAPVRSTRRVEGFHEEFGSIGHFDDDYNSIMSRIDRLVGTASAWSEDPPSRTRRFVTNVTVHETETPDEYAISSYLLLTRNRADAKDYKQLSAERLDRLRWTGGRFLLFRREILVDQVVLGMPNLAVFL